MKFEWDIKKARINEQKHTHTRLILKQPPAFSLTLIAMRNMMQTMMKMKKDGKSPAWQARLY